jgi:hypothetical protein
MDKECLISIQGTTRRDAIKNEICREKEGLSEDKRLETFCSLTCIKWKLC